MFRKQFYEQLVDSLFEIQWPIFCLIQCVRILSKLVFNSVGKTLPTCVYVIIVISKPADHGAENGSVVLCRSHGMDSMSSHAHYGKRWDAHRPNTCGHD